jgi:hypothetical protein
MSISSLFNVSDEAFNLISPVCPLDCTNTKQYPLKAIRWFALSGSPSESSQKVSLGNFSLSS